MPGTDLIERFLAAAASTTASVETVQRDDEALNDALLRSAGDGPIIFASAGDIDPILFSRFRENEKVISHPTIDEMKTIRVGVTDAFCGIASTGSVCVSIGRELTGPVSSLTRKHIAVLDGNTIVPRPRDVFSEEYLGGKGLRRSFSFITGPSATADMGPLVRGVHGPGKLHIIVLV